MICCFNFFEIFFEVLFRIFRLFRLIVHVIIFFFVRDKIGLVFPLISFEKVFDVVSDSDNNKTVVSLKKSYNEKNSEKKRRKKTSIKKRKKKII